MKSLRALMFGLIAAIGFASMAFSQVNDLGGTDQGATRVAVIPIDAEIDLRAAAFA